MRLIRDCLIAMLALAPASSALAADSASSTYQVNAAHDGAVTFAEPFAPPLRKHWSVDLGGAVSYPIVAGNLAIVIADAPIGTMIAAFDIATGKPAWRKLISGSEGSSFLGYDAGILYLLSYHGPLEAFTAATGAPRWSVTLPIESYFNYLPVAEGGSVYAAGDESGVMIYRLNGRTGHLDWKKLFNGGSYGATIGAGLLYFGSGCDTPAQNPATGAVVWEYRSDCETSDVPPATYYAGRLYVSAGIPISGVVLDAKTGKSLRSLAGEPPAFWGKTSFQVVGGSLVAANINTLKTLWRFTPPDTLSTPPIVIDGLVCSLSQTGKLYINSSATGQLLQTLNVGLGSLKTTINAPASGLGAGQNTLFVPSGSILAAFGK